VRERGIESEKSLYLPIFYELGGIDFSKLFFVYKKYLQKIHIWFVYNKNAFGAYTSLEKYY